MLTCDRSVKLYDKCSVTEINTHNLEGPYYSNAVGRGTPPVSQGDTMSIYTQRFEVTVGSTIAVVI